MKNLLAYINNQEDPTANFALALEYENMGQTGAAISFYLRAAERSRNDLEQYEALLRMALCFAKQKTRDDNRNQPTKIYPSW
jgi:tetratricopeptide (TPR) repeat protein